LAGYAFDSAIEEVGDVGELRAPKDFEHEIRAGDALHGAVALETANPRERCSIGNVELGGLVCLSNRTGAPGLQHTMHTRDTDIAFARLAQELNDVRERSFHIDGVDIDAKNMSEGMAACLLHDEWLSMLVAELGLDKVTSWFAMVVLSS